MKKPNFNRSTNLNGKSQTELDARSGALIVKQGAEGPNTALEEEMLEVSEFIVAINIG